MQFKGLVLEKEDSKRCGLVKGAVHKHAHEVQSKPCFASGLASCM